jgi:hypothetical protein
VFTLKPSLGVNVCQVHGDGYSGFHKLGLFAGVAVNAYLKPKSSLEIGFYFSQKGARHIPNPNKGDFHFYSLNMNYIDVPVSFRYQLNKDYFISLGPSIAILTGYFEEIDYVNYTGSYPVNLFEYGINFGLGKKIKDRFFVEIRTSNSYIPIRGYGSFVNNVYYSNFIAKAFNKGFYNNILTLFVSYKIYLKRKSIEPK